MAVRGYTTIGRRMDNVLRIRSPVTNRCVLRISSPNFSHTFFSSRRVRNCINRAIDLHLVRTVNRNSRGHHGTANALSDVSRASLGLASTSNRRFRVTLDGVSGTRLVCRSIWLRCSVMV